MPRIREVVEDLLAKQSLAKAPIPVERLAQNLGVELRYEPFAGEQDQVSGMLFRDGGRTVIGINANEGQLRQRFTIAHEIGHLLLHKAPMYLDTPAEVFMRNQRSSQSVDPKEIQANTFAAELLMPEKLVRAEAADAQAELSKRSPLVDTEELVERLAQKFQVSIQAMTFRLANLGVIKLA